MLKITIVKVSQEPGSHLMVTAIVDPPTCDTTDDGSDLVTQILRQHDQNCLQYLGLHCGEAILFQDRGGA